MSRAPIILVVPPIAAPAWPGVRPATVAAHLIEKAVTPDDTGDGAAR